MKMRLVALLALTSCRCGLDGECTADSDQQREQDDCHHDQ